MFTYNPEKSWRATNTCKMPSLALGAAGDPGHLDNQSDSADDLWSRHRLRHVLRVACPICCATTTFVEMRFPH